MPCTICRKSGHNKRTCTGHNKRGTYTAFIISDPEVKEELRETWYRAQVFLTAGAMGRVSAAIKIQRAVRNWIPGKSCPICMDEITAKNSCVTKCGHDFCLSCLAKSLQRNQTCPLCRDDLVPVIDRQAMSQASFENGYRAGIDMMREEMREEMNVGYAYSQHTYELGLDEGRRLAQEEAEDTIQALRRKLDRALKKVVELTPIQVSSL
jgi:hypothetical protein